MLRGKTIITQILVICLGILATVVYSNTEVNSIQAGKIVEDTVNKYFMRGEKADIKGKVAEESGLYKANIIIGNTTQAFYLTKDGSHLIFPDGIVSVNQLEESAKKEAVQAQIPKKDKPVVELYVMSLCPFGVKAEKQLLPLMDYFCDRVDFRIRYIVNVKGQTLNDIVSLHGSDEVKEDARQAAIFKYQSDKFAPYLEKIEKKSCLLSCGEVKLDDYWKQAAEELGIDVAKVESFAYGPEGLALLKSDSSAAQKYGAAASPTLIINGVKSEAIYKGGDTLKQAICSAFTDSPALCPKESAAQAKK